MTFPINVNIPNAPNDPADDQPLMKQNFANISGFLSVDHVAPGAVGAGKHAQVELPFKSVDFPTIAGQGTLYSKGVGINNDAELFWRFQVGPPLQLTNNFYTVAGANPGVVPLMNGCIMQFGITTTVGTTTPITFAVPFRLNGVLNAPYSIQTSPITSPAFSLNGISAPSSGGFDYLIPSATPNYNVYWIAIGPYS